MNADHARERHRRGDGTRPHPAGWADPAQHGCEVNLHRPRPAARAATARTSTGGLGGRLVQRLPRDGRLRGVARELHVLPRRRATGRPDAARWTPGAERHDERLRRRARVARRDHARDAARLHRVPPGAQRQRPRGRGAHRRERRRRGRLRHAREDRRRGRDLHAVERHERDVRLDLLPRRGSPAARTRATSWTSTTQVGCTSCHGAPPSTGEHQRSNHRSRSCGDCHGTGYSATGVVAATHVNGSVQVGNRITTFNGTTCTNACHGSETW